MKVFTLLLLFALPAVAQEQPAFLDSINHNYGDGRLSFALRDGRLCSFTARVEVKSPEMWKGLTPYDRAFSYTLRNLTPMQSDPECFFPRRVDYDFPSLCRAWSTSDGSFAIDVPYVGMIQTYPRTAEVRAYWQQNAVKGPNYGVAITRLWYRVSILEDGGIQVLAYIPKGWDTKPQQ